MAEKEKFNFDFTDMDPDMDTVDDLPDNTTDRQGDSKYESDFVTFWRSSGMLGVRKTFGNANRQGVMFTFMQGEGNKDPKQNSYKKETRTLFSVEKEEVFNIIHACEQILDAAKNSKVGQGYSLTHTYKDETKSMNIAQSKNNPATIFVGITKGQEKISVMMNVKDFEYFIFALKMILYEIYVGSRVGFTVNWI